MSEPTPSRRELILATAEDQALDMVFYDRKEDEDLPRGGIEAAIAAGEVSLDDILIAFRTKLIEALGEDNDDQ